MFHKGFFVLRILATLLLVGLLIGGGFALFRAGQAQGYAQGLATASQNTTTGAAPAVPAAPYAPWMVPGYPYRYGFYGPHFFPVFPFFAVGALIFFTVFVFGGLMRMRMMRHMMAAGPWKGHSGHFGPLWQDKPEAKTEGAPETKTDPGSEPKA